MNRATSQKASRSADLRPETQAVAEPVSAEETGRAELAGPAQQTAIASSHTSSLISHDTENQHPDTNLDKVRELLFGSQVRTQEQQFQEIERQLAATRAEFTARFERLEDIVDKGFNSLTQQIQTEREARQQALSRTQEASRAAEADLSQKLAKLDKKLDSETQSLLQDILEQSSQLTAAMHEKSELLLEEIDKEMNQRRSQTQAERDHLSALFGELSARLKDAG